MVIGQDSRVKVTNTTAWPYRALVYVRAYFAKLPGAYLQGTGTLIGAETVLTAAHVVYSPLYGGYSSKVEVVPAYNRGAAPYGTAVGNKLDLLPGYTSSLSNASDMAVVKLSSAIGKKTGWLKSASGIKVGQTLTLSGYSADLGGALGTSSGVMLSVSPLVLYTIDSTSGSSGSPLYNAADQVQAVHGFSEGTTLNGGAPITSSINNTLIQWRNASSNVTNVNKLVYVKSANWNRYSSFTFAVLGTTKLNAIYRVKQTALAYNGETYAALYNYSGQFQGWTNVGDFGNESTTAVNKTLKVHATVTRYGDLWLHTTRGTTSGYVNKSVYVTTRNVVGVNRVVYSLWTKAKGGTWLGYVDASKVW